VRAYLQLGVRVVGLTSALFAAEALARRDMDAIRQKAEEAARAASVD
jgi:2-keto-3-deoxy-6-phosphogluconate aldolase